MYNVEQYVMAYSAEHARIKELLAEGFSSLRPVLRLNAELITPAGCCDERAAHARIEFNTPVEGRGKRGWLNLIVLDGRCADIAIERDGAATALAVSMGGHKLLNIRFTRVGREGGCPKEDDNDGTFYSAYTADKCVFSPVEIIDGRKEYCDCEFDWSVPLAAVPPYNAETLVRAAGIPCEKILGAYAVNFLRREER